jgi:hypothetical protein
MSAAAEQEQEPHLRMPRLPLPPPSACLRPAAKTALSCSVTVLELELELVLVPVPVLVPVLEPAIAAPCQQVARPPTRDLPPPEPSRDHRDDAPPRPLQKRTQRH